MTGIESLFIGRPALHPVTIPSTLSWLCNQEVTSCMHLSTCLIFKALNGFYLNLVGEGGRCQNFIFIPIISRGPTFSLLLLTVIKLLNRTSVVPHAMA